MREGRRAKKGLILVTIGGGWEGKKERGLKNKRGEESLGWVVVVAAGVREQRPGEREEGWRGQRGGLYRRGEDGGRE